MKARIDSITTEGNKGSINVSILSDDDVEIKKKSIIIRDMESLTPAEAKAKVGALIEESESDDVKNKKFDSLVGKTFTKDKLKP